MMRDIEGHVLNILNWLSEHGVGVSSNPIVTSTNNPQPQTELPQSGFAFHREYIIRVRNKLKIILLISKLIFFHTMQKSADHLAIPITINVVLIISDTLLIWASGARYFEYLKDVELYEIIYFFDEKKQDFNLALVDPSLYGVSIFHHCFDICYGGITRTMDKGEFCLNHVKNILKTHFFQVVVFLICCPIILLLGFFWLVVKCFYNFLRDVHIKAAVAAVYQNGMNPPPQSFQGSFNHHAQGYQKVSVC